MSKDVMSLRFEIARGIRAFLKGNGGRWDWDDFISIPVKDHVILDALRLYCAGIQNKYPAANPGAYCNDVGLSELVRLADLLERGSDIEINDEGVPQQASTT